MRKLTAIMTIGVLFLFSCAKTPVCPDALAPEIVSITSRPEVNTALLISELRKSPSGMVECGFYVGRDEVNLIRTQGIISGKTISLVLDGLDQNTIYYFKAFVSNGFNEICSGFESFVTRMSPDPVDPDDPVIPDDPVDPIDPDDPDKPVDPDDPDEPVDPVDPVDPNEPDDPVGPNEPVDPDDPVDPVEFTTEIGDVSFSVGNDILELTAVLSGDVTLIKTAGFMLGTSADNLSRISGSVEGTLLKAYLAGLEAGTYYYKAFISNGSETKESEIREIALQ